MKRTWEWVKEVWHGLTYILAWGGLLANLIAIAIYKRVMIYEDYPYTLWAEIVMSVAFLALGFERLVKDIRRRRRKLS